MVAPNPCNGRMDKAKQQTEDLIVRELQEHLRAIRNVLGRSILVSLRSSVMALRCRPRLGVEAVMDLGLVVSNWNDRSPKVIIIR